MSYTAMRREKLSETPMLPRVTHPRRLKRVYNALRGAQLPLTAQDLGTICNLSPSTVARYLRVLKNYGYPIHTRQRKTYGAMEYQLVEEPATQRG